MVELLGKRWGEENIRDWLIGTPLTSSGSDDYNKDKEIEGKRRKRMVILYIVAMYTYYYYYYYYYYLFFTKKPLVIETLCPS